jgi:hypothetical protein
MADTDKVWGEEVEQEGGEGAYAEEKHLWGKETGGCMILIESGSLGINAVASLDPEYTLQFRHFTGASNAKEQAAGKLTEGMVLTHINGVDQKGVGYEEVCSALGARPCKMQFVKGEEPRYHPTHGFPMNVSAKVLCALQWKTIQNPHEPMRTFQPGSATEAVISIDFADIIVATNNFHESQKLGEGGSCTVYRGNIFGVPCAIKRFTPDAESEWLEKQFKDEVKSSCS